MSMRDWQREEVVSNRNLCGAVAAAAGASAAVAQTAGAPVAVAITLGLVAVAGLIAVVVLHLIERRLPAPAGSPVKRDVPRSDFNKPEKFVNRERELGQLDRLLERAERGEGPLIAVLGGLPGVGKSAVGRYWADLVRERFPDGDLLADFSQRRRGGAVDVSGFLDDFIRRLGPADAVVPTTPEERVDRYRSMTVGRKMLVLLDDVSEAAEVKQLRPAGKGSLVIATTYRPIEELHYDGAEFVPVDPLHPDRAEELLAEMAGSYGAAVKAHPKETKELLRYCGGLALPLCVCGARLLLGRGERTVASILAEVTDEQRRLDYLSGKGEYAGAAVFGFAYGDLAAEERLVYRRAGLHPGIEVTPVHAALLTGLAPADSGDRLRALADTYLLEEREGGRFHFHDLVRLHARECTVGEDPEEEREALLSKLVDWYHAGLRRADWALITERLRLAPEEPLDAPYLPEFSDRDSVFEWLEAERPNILAVLQSASEREWDERVWQMVESLWLFHYNRRHYADWIDATKLGVASARRAGHRDAEARLRTQLAWAYVELRRYDAAHAELDRANRIVKETGNGNLAGSVREFTGTCYLKEGKYDDAIAALEEAREVAVRVESERGIALQDYFIGWALIGKGEFARALEALDASLTRMRRADDPMFVGRLLLRIGQANLQIGKPEKAEASLREGLEVLTDLGMRVEEAETYEELAAVAEGREDDEDARLQRERAQAIYREIGHPRAGEPATGSLLSAADAMTI